MSDLVVLSAICLGSCGTEVKERQMTPFNSRETSVIMANQYEGVVATNIQYLIFEFPDGVRGGFGAIWGDSPPSPINSSGDLPLLRRCGAVEPKFKSVWSHSTHIVTRSIEKDFAVVACFKRNTSSHFNVGIGSDSSLRSSSLDSVRFKSLENNPKRKQIR